MKQITYGVYSCGRIERVEQTDAEVLAKYNAFNAFICGLEDDDEADEIIEAIGNYVWALTKAEERKARKALVELIAPYEMNTESAVIWYAHDEMN